MSNLKPIPGKMKQILVATDFSATAANALKYAIKLAKILKMQVCIIHAIHPTEGINNNIYNAFFIDEYYNNKKLALAELALKYTSKEKYKNIKITTQCEVGFLKAVITKYKSKHPVDLLVIGITGATGITDIVGSNASMLVSKLKIPTLIVPLQSRFSKVPVITLATDYEARLSADDAIALNEIVQGFGSKKVQVLYVAEKPGDKNITVGEEKLRKLVKKPLEFNYITNVSPINGIMDFITKSETDILCVVKHHHNIIYRLFSRSTINQVMNKSVKAILVLHE